MFRPQRPSIKARDSSGNSVSLLNDEPSKSIDYQHYAPPDFLAFGSPGLIAAPSTISNSTPSTPDLMRADSYDSQRQTDPHSPTTPPYIDQYARQMSFGDLTSYKDPMYDQHDPMSFYPPPTQQYNVPVRPQFDTRLPSFSDPIFQQPAPQQQQQEEEQYPKGAKRYPCRFKESHGCDRTFTTSGHASRHSKIHTAEKAVQCTFAGCQKKFTRADNMKQHLETHYKDRARGSSSKPSSSKSSALTVAAGVKKQRAPSRTSSRAEIRPSPIEAPMPMAMSMPMPIMEQPLMDPALFEPYFPPSSSFTLNDIPDPLQSPNGLDALAAAAAQSQD
jgi:uncharacterized Zn-finger protein